MATSYLDIEGLRRFYQIISGRIATKLPVVAKTKSEWQTSGGVISEAGVLYIITDYKTIQRNNDTYNVPAFKLGDG